MEISKFSENNISYFPLWVTYLQFSLLLTLFRKIKLITIPKTLNIIKLVEYYLNINILFQFIFNYL